MQRLTMVATAAAFLMGTITAPAIAQAPSPPPWFGGWVEMPDHGFAITLPHGWVALDVTTDVDRQLDVVFDAAGSEVWGVDGEVIRTFGVVEGVQLQMFDTSSASMCTVEVYRVLGVSVDDVARVIATGNADDPTLVDVDLKLDIELPAGPAASVRATLQEAPGIESQATNYLIGGDGPMSHIVCMALGGERPADDWLRVVEAFEFLPDEQPSASGTFNPTGSLAEARGHHTATLLPDGRVLVVGGTTDGDQVLASAEVWDPATGTFSPTGSLAEARGLHSATLLPDGRVLVVGGTPGGSELLASTEAWDPSTGTFSKTGSLVEARGLHTATLLPDGQVLVVGGVSDVVQVLASAVVRDSTTGTFGPTGSLAEAHASHTATLLADGRVLIIGGFGREHLSSPEVWDPATGTFNSTGPSSGERMLHTATHLPDGRVLVAGGRGLDGNLATAEVWDVATEAFDSTGSLTEPRESHTATLLPDGRVLVVGGSGGETLNTSDTAEVWDPATNTFDSTGSLAEARSGHTATLLPDGRVLIVGGGGNLEITASAEVWNPGEA